jgi:membrane fusion protein, heavy metal efflux system
VLLASFGSFGCQAPKGSGAPERDVPHMEGETVVFSEAFRKRAEITTAAVVREPFRPTVRLSGTVSLNPSHVAVVGTRVRGTVRRTFKVEGDEVRAGDALAEIESAELGEAQSNVIQAEASLLAAEVNARRETDLLGRNLTTAREAEVAATELSNRKAGMQAAQQRVKAYGGSGAFGLYVVKSPIAGHVVSGHLSPGQSVDANGASFKVADVTHLWVELSVFERDLAALCVGDDVDIRPSSEPEVRINGRVAHIGELIDATTRSTEVRITVDAPSYHLRPGQSVNAVITTKTSGREALLVPHEAVVYVDGKPTLFVAESETRMKAIPVRLGASDGARHEVLEGLTSGQRVATSGVFALKSELFR